MDNRDEAGGEAGHEAAVRARAYQLWVESGYADGYQDQHWRQAEREIAERAAARGSAEERGPQPPAAARDRGRARNAPHSDGMSAHPSVLDPGPGRSRS